MHVKPATPGPSAAFDDLRVAEARGRRLLSQAVVRAAAGMILVVLAVAMAVALSNQPPSSSVLLAFGAGVLGSLALAAVRYDALVALGVLLLAAVQLEPAPSDFIFGVAIALALVTGQLAASRIPPGVVWLVTV